LPRGRGAGHPPPATGHHHIPNTVVIHHPEAPKPPVVPVPARPRAWTLAEERPAAPAEIAAAKAVTDARKRGATAESGQPRRLFRVGARRGGRRPDDRRPSRGDR
jgi:hypothetical protein